jgi:hypothetical protein
MVLNPQYIPPVSEHVSFTQEWSLRNNGFVNMQTFKAWKHVHELVGSIRHMPKKQDGELREVAGRGIEYQYMTSVDKCKPQYFHEDGERFWDAALENGMVYHDYWNTNQVSEWLSRAMVLVDPSWSKKYSQIGGHWNRVIVDAMIHGAIPMAHPKHMGNELFVAGKHYVPLPDTEDLKEYADAVMEAGHMNMIDYSHYREYGQDLLPNFDRQAVAADLVDLALGETEVTQGTSEEHLVIKCEDLMFDHYGVI